MALSEIGSIAGAQGGPAVLGAGTAFAKHHLSNSDVLLRMGDKYQNENRRRFAAAGLEETLGVRERTWTHLVGEAQRDDEESSVDLAVRAARAALHDAGLSASDLGLIICSTSSPHRMTGTSSAAVHAALQANGITVDCAGMDVRTGCAGGLFALVTAGLYLQAGVGPVLLVGSETFSKVIPHMHKTPMVALGDGAGALVLGQRKGAQIHAGFMRSDGALSGLVATQGVMPPTAQAIASGGYLLSGDPERLGAELPGKYLEAIGSVQERNGGVPLDLFVPHQTSRPLIEALADKANIARDKTFINVERHANIGVAGWMVALAEAREQKRVSSGSTVLLAAVGGGMSWAAVSWTL